MHAFPVSRLLPIRAICIHRGNDPFYRLLEVPNDAVEKDTVQISYSLDNQQWSMIRLAYFPPNVPVEIGMVAAAPGKEPFEVCFENFSISSLSSPPKED